MAGTLLFNALREAIDEEMGRDPHVCVMGEDVGHYGGSYKVTKDLAEKYGDLRVLDTPIAENGFTGMRRLSPRASQARKPAVTAPEKKLSGPLRGSRGSGLESVMLRS